MDRLNIRARDDSLWPQTNIWYKLTLAPLIPLQQKQAYIIGVAHPSQNVVDLTCHLLDHPWSDLTLEAIPQSYRIYVYLLFFRWFVVVSQSTLSELCSIPQFITEESITLYSQHIYIKTEEMTLYICVNTPIPRLSSESPCISSCDLVQCLTQYMYLVYKAKKPDQRSAGKFF